MEFKLMMKEKNGSGLSRWISKTADSGIKEIASFATGLEADLPAVQNAFNLKWSNGPVEGNVNKLKFIKRQMYGRAGFDLLKKKIDIGLRLTTKSGEEPTCSIISIPLLSL